MYNKYSINIDPIIEKKLYKLIKKLSMEIQ